MKKNNYKAFTFIEIMVWIIIVSLIIIAWFQAYISVNFWKINLIWKTDIQVDSHYFKEKLFQLIKQWWTIDYEEYFNRKVVDATNTSSWHYSSSTWFWNFWKWWNIFSSGPYWNWYYLCRSTSTDSVTDWCFDSLDLSSDYAWNVFDWWNWTSFWDLQRYWQYSLQFIDYNSNRNSDNWDEDWDGQIRWDDDDEYLGLWPTVAPDWSDVKELYLISWDWKNRTIIRWNIKNDDYSPSWSTCDATASTIDFSDSSLLWCRWTVEFLRLEWYDYWLDHDNSTVDSDGSQYDGIIDTWHYDTKLTWWSDIVALSWEGYWKELFPDSVNVTDFKVYIYPNINPELSWRDSSPSSKISPYVVIKFKVKPSWKVRSLLKNDWKEVSFVTTVNLTDIYSK